jgi:hypothetical protein
MVMLIQRLSFGYTKGLMQLRHRQRLMQQLMPGHRQRLMQRLSL